EGDAREAARARLLTPAVKYWVCKRAPGLIYEAMECLGGEGYWGGGHLPRTHPGAPGHTLWGSAGQREGRRWAAGVRRGRRSRARGAGGACRGSGRSGGRAGGGRCHRARGGGGGCRGRGARRRRSPCFAGGGGGVTAERSRGRGPVRAHAARRGPRGDLRNERDISRRRAPSHRPRVAGGVTKRGQPWVWHYVSLISLSQLPAFRMDICMTRISRPGRRTTEGELRPL